MTDIDFASLIEEGAHSWNQWRINNPTVQPDLSKAYLFGQVLAGFDLSGVNLERACLIGADLKGANLKNARLQSVYASSADFSAADLSNATLQGSSLGKANFRGANLSGAQAFGTNFSGAVFTGAYLSAWHIDETTVLSGLQATHIYLAAELKQAPSESIASETISKQQRHPHTGQFQPGALEPFLRLAAVQSAAIPTTLSVAPAGKLVANISHQVKTLISSKTAGKMRDRLQPAVLTQTGQRVSKQVTQNVIATTIWAVEQAKTIHNSEAMGQIIIAFRPDSTDHVTPGALHQLNPTATDRLKAPIHTLLEVEAIRSTIHGTSHRTRQIQRKTQTLLSRRLEAFSQSSAWATFIVITRSKAGRYIIDLFQPDSTDRVTLGALTPYLHKFNAERISQTTVQATAQATRQSVKQLKVLFTPDSVEQVTVGKLHQLSPDTLNRLERLLLLEKIHAAGAKIGDVTTSTKSAAIHHMDVISHSAVLVQVTTWMRSEPICRVTQHFKPDGVDCITQGALHDVLKKVLAQHPLENTEGGTEQGKSQVRSPLKTKLRLLVSPLVTAETRDRAQQLISTLSSPKKLEAEIKKICDQHPISAGLGATAALGILLLNLMPQSGAQSNPQANGLLGKTARSLSTALPLPHSASTAKTSTAETSTHSITDPATSVQTSASPSGMPRPILEVASIAMPCQIGGASRQAVDPGNSYEYENGAIYYGAISNGQPADGQGTMIYPTGNRYEGDYQNGQRQGCGTFTFANGRQYIGQFEADQFDGRGTWIIENGERYIGEFKNNQCSGTGTFIFANGSTKSGIWADGKLPGSQISCDRGSLTLPSSQDM